MEIAKHSRKGVVPIIDTPSDPASEDTATPVRCHYEHYPRSSKNRKQGLISIFAQNLKAKVHSCAGIMSFYLQFTVDISHVTGMDRKFCFMALFAFRHPQLQSYPKQVYLFI